MAAQHRVWGLTPNDIYPYLVSLHYERNYIGAGVLVSRRLVLTAGHNVAPTEGQLIIHEKLRVVAGSEENDIDGNFGFQRYFTTGEYIMAPNIKYWEFEGFIENDLALIILHQLVPMTNTISTIDIGSPHHGPHYMNPGWGCSFLQEHRVENCPLISSFRVRNLKRISNKYCLSRYKEQEVKNRMLFVLKNYGVCLRDVYTGTATAAGSSGTPLIVEQNYVFKVVGIIVNGAHCHDTYFGSFAADVTNLPWIKQAIKQYP